MAQSPQDAPGNPGAVVPAAAGVAYSVAAWDDECFMLFAEGRDPAPCPACGHTGFYGPRVGGDGSRFRACRFCGLYQLVDAPPARAHPSAHNCADWPEVARAQYVWWSPPDQVEYTCPFCGKRANVREHKIAAPSDDPSHPWWKVPQNRTRFYYSRFWENWPYTKGRVFL